MSIWSEGFDLRADEDAGLSAVAVYYAGGSALPRTFRGPFNELTPSPVQDDRQGRREVRQAVLELPLVNGDGTVQIAVDGKSYFEIRDQRWVPEKVMQGRGNWVVYLCLAADQSIRMIQSSTRR